MPDTAGGRRQDFKRFNYEAKEPAAPRLSQLLKLSNTATNVKVIMRTIENIGEKHLDLNATLSEQETAMSVIQDQIVSRYPGLFVGQRNEESLFFALRMVGQKHRRARDCERSRQRRRREGELAITSKNERQPGEVVDLTMDEKYEDEENLDQEPEETQASAQANHNTNKRPSKGESATKRIGRKATQIRAFGSYEVKRFLSACTPPMDRYLQQFMNFGCNSENFLRGMSSWAPEKRVTTLKKILTGPEGESVVTEMELAVIENALETYFMDG